MKTEMGKEEPCSLKTESSDELVLIPVKRPHKTVSLESP